MSWRPRPRRRLSAARRARPTPRLFSPRHRTHAMSDQSGPLPPFEEDAGQPALDDAETLPELSNRRAFLRRASALTLAIAGIGAPRPAWSSDEREHGERTAANARQRPGQDTARARHDSLQFRTP